MAERGGLAPHPGSNGTTSLAGKPGTLGWFAFHGPGGRTCTRTERGLSSLPLHWATPGNENGGPGRICTVTFRVKVGCSRCLSYRADRKWTRTPDLHRVNRFCRPTIRLFILCAIEDWVDQPDLHRHCRLHRAGCYCYNMVNIGNGAPARTRTSNLRLRTAVCRTLTPRELENMALHAGAAPASAA